MELSAEFTTTSIVAGALSTRTRLSPPILAPYTGTVFCFVLMVLLRVFIHQAPCRFLLLNSCSLLKPSTPCRATLPEILTTEAGGRDVCVHGSRPKATRPLAPARHPTCRCRRTSSQDIFISGRRGTTAAASCQPSRNGLTDDERLFPHHTPVEEREYFHIIQHHLQGAKLPPSLTTAGSSRLLVTLPIKTRDLIQYI